MTDDLDDPFVQGLIEEFGGDGYLVYFGTVSLLCRQQTKENLTGNFEFSVSFLRKKFQVSAKKLAKIYQFSETFRKLSCHFSEKKVQVSIPKILDIADDWTKKLRSNSEVTPKILPHEVRSKKKEVEVIKEKINKKEKVVDSQDDHFEKVWSEYPSESKTGKKDARRHYKASVKTEEDRQSIETALKNYKDFVEHKRKTGFPDLNFKYGSTWFNNWRDDIERRVDLLGNAPPKEPTEAELIEERKREQAKQKMLCGRTEYLQIYGSEALNQAILEGSI